MKNEASVSAKFGWTVVCDTTAKCGFKVYMRDCPPDEAHFAADLAPFTFPTKSAAVAAGKLGNFAYKR